MFFDRNDEMTTFLARPATISHAARDASIRFGSLRSRSCGSSSDPRTIGPATRWGKNDR